MSRGKYNWMQSAAKPEAGDTSMSNSEVEPKNQEALRTKTSTHFRLTDDAIAMLDRLSAAHGINRTSVIELAIRRMAEDKEMK